MKKILITSSGVARKPMREKIAEIISPKTYPTLAYIPTASKVVKDPSYALKDRQILIDLGYQISELDLAEVRGENLEQQLRQTDAMYVQGGNPYWILKHVQESGFNKIVPKLIEEGMPYIGKSAGGYILAPEVIVPTWYDNSWRKFNVTDLTGLNLVPFVWAAHFDPANSQMIENIKTGIKKTHYVVRAITNDQGFLITDQSTRLIGIGAEFYFEQPKPLSG